jgi:hypothetical protein
MVTGEAFEDRLERLTAAVERLSAQVEALSGGSPTSGEPATVTDSR